ncbi:MAG: 50S ribosomal protein L10 [Candidatus Caenarcaniphilales bacterium]|nr:50S ribosomal protein L10 [Candidatus Caenarcaniphilales bacterium]
MFEGGLKRSELRKDKTLVTKAQKEELIAKIKEHSKDSTIAFVADFNALSVADFTTLRRSMKGKGKCVVVKNTLAARALDDGVFANVKDFLSGTSLLVFGKDEAPATIKAFLEQQKKLDPKLSLKGGVIAGDPNALDGKSIRAIGELPPKEVLLAQIAGALTSCPQTIVQSINQTISSIGELAVKVAEKNGK